MNRFVFFAVLISLVPAGTVSKGQFCPDEAFPWSNGAPPFRATICDVNLDGLPDIVSANADTDDITIHLNGSEGFDPPQLFPAGNEPVDVDCCDVDGDGQLDIVTANRSESKISILRNQGIVDGVIELSTPVPYSVGLAPWGIRCVHLNNDTMPELVTSNFTGQSVSVLLNNADGTFTTSPELPSGGNGTYYIATCDLDGDLDDDVVVSNMTGQTITSFRNEGDGTLTRIGSYSVGTLVFPWGIACCDVDGDGAPDAVTANGGDSTISVLRNDGIGQFNSWLPAIFEGPGQPFGIACNDIDSDCDADVLTANLGSDDVSILINNGQGSFVLERSLPIGVNVGSVQAADVDLDGDVDILASAGTDIIEFANVCLHGDFNGDGVVDWLDHAGFVNCLTGPGKPVPTGCEKFAECEKFDLNRDGAVELIDWSNFQLILQP